MRLEKRNKEEMIKKIIFIGAINIGKPSSDGETMKNQLFLTRFNELYNKVISIDTYNWRKRPWCLIHLLIALLFNKGAKVVISCEERAYTIVKFLYYFRLKKEVYYWVVGGGLHKAIESGKYKVKYYHYLRKIFVQSPSMVKSLELLGINNSLYVPNSKPYFKIEKPSISNDRVNFVFLSRLIKEKGCEYIFSSIRRLNNEGLCKKFTVTFYGKTYHESVHYPQIINSIPNASYKGVLNLKIKTGYEELALYNVFLFPTFYPNEGFPGVIIDAYMAGLPVIASDWNFNKDVVDSNNTGLLIPVHDEESLYNAMKYYIFNRSIINKQSKVCLEKAALYDSKTILSEDFFMKVGLLS